MSNKFDVNNIDVAWCPGCGNFPLLNIVKQAITELKLDETNTVFVSGIG